MSSRTSAAAARLDRDPTPKKRTTNGSLRFSAAFNDGHVRVNPTMTGEEEDALEMLESGSMKSVTSSVNVDEVGFGDPQGQIKRRNVDGYKFFLTCEGSCTDTIESSFVLAFFFL
jgi:hypothetical protein